MKNYGGLPDKEIIRRLKDRKAYLEIENKRHIECEKNRMFVHVKLFEFMTKNNLWDLYYKQEGELSKK